jgi:hypothetical protein
VGLVDERVSELGRRLLAREGELGAAILSRVRQVAADSDRDGDPERVEAMRQTIAAAVHVDLLRIERDDPALAAPAGAWENVRLAAHNGMSLSATLQSYVTGHLVSWEFVVDEAAKLELAEAERVALLRRVSLLESAYFNDLVGRVSDAYMRELERVTHGREQRRAQLVREVLDGGEVTVAELGYELAGAHVGLVVSAERPEEVVRGVAASVDRRSLVVSRSERTVWAWLGGQRPLDPACVLDAVKGSGSESEDVRVAVGEPGSGVEGFRVTHHQARAAYLVAHCRPTGVTRYADVSLVAFGLQDDVLGPAFVDLWLGALGDDSSRAAILRETLRAYFQADHNAASAACVLGVTDRTVAYRLRAVEERLGHSITSRRAELEIALCLAELRERPACSAAS